MKKFNLELAKKGHPVCTRDGRNARIISFDRKSIDEFYSIIALVDYGENELAHSFTKEGLYQSTCESNLDLFMKPIKREGWLNIYENESTTTCGCIYETEEKAMRCKHEELGYIQTIKIEWEA